LGLPSDSNDFNKYVNHTVNKFTKTLRSPE
jgi:hypothetical protein